MARRKPPAHLIGSGLIPGTYDTQYADVQHNYDTQMGQYAGQERDLYRDYGMTGSIDPTTGQMTYSVDPTARFGKFQDWLRGLAGNLAGARQEAVSRGLTGKGGLAQAREGLTRFAASQEQSNMFNQMQSAATGIYNARTQAAMDRDRGFHDTEAQAQAWWDQYGPEDDSAPDGAQPPPGAKGKPPRGVYKWQHNPYQRGYEG